MTTTTNIQFYQHEQPPGGWKKLLQWAKEWNSTHEVPFNKTLSYILHATFTTNATALRNEVTGFAETEGLQYHVFETRTFEASDYDTAPFINLLGDALPDQALRNEAAAFPDPLPCSVCGNYDAFRDPAVPLLFDTTLLDEGGADLYNLPNGHLLAGPAFVQALRNADATGFDLHPVTVAGSGQLSSQWFRLQATQAVVKPCPQHTPVADPGICPKCGTVLGKISGEFYVNLQAITATDILSRHPVKGGLLYISNRLYHVLVAADIRGLYWNNILYTCDHPVIQ